jgi:hypothetical protein
MYLKTHRSPLPVAWEPVNFLDRYYVRCNSSDRWTIAGRDDPAPTTAGFEAIRKTEEAAQRGFSRKSCRVPSTSEVPAGSGTLDSTAKAAARVAEASQTRQTPRR